MSARDALAKICSTQMVWTLNYDPEGPGRYILNLTRVPQPPQPLNPFPVPANPGPVIQSASPSPILALRNMSPRVRIGIQAKLAQAGFYKGELNGNWTSGTVEAMKKFQAANNLAVTGLPDPKTIEKLGLSAAATQSH